MRHIRHKIWKLLEGLKKFEILGAKICLRDYSYSEGIDWQKCELYGNGYYREEGKILEVNGKEIFQLSIISTGTKTIKRAILQWKW